MKNIKPVLKTLFFFLVFTVGSAFFIVGADYKTFVLYLFLGALIGIPIGLLSPIQQKKSNNNYKTAFYAMLAVDIIVIVIVFVVIYLIFNKIISIQDIFSHSIVLVAVKFVGLIYGMIFSMVLI